MKFSRHFITAALLSALIIQPASAEPRHHWWRDWKNWAIIGVTIGASAAATHEGHSCRLRLDVASCAGGYGPFAAREGVRFSMGAVAAGMTIYAREHRDMFGKETWIPFAAYTTWATEVAVRQGTRAGPARTDRPKP